MLFFVLNIFVSIITDSFDKIRYDAKDHPKDYNVDIIKYLSQKLRYIGFKNDLKRKPNEVTYENYIDYLTSFHIQTNRLIDVLAEVFFIFILKKIFRWGKICSSLITYKSLLFNQSNLKVYLYSF